MLRIFTIPGIDMLHLQEDHIEVDESNCENSENSCTKLKRTLLHLIEPELALHQEGKTLEGQEHDQTEYDLRSVH